MIEGLEGILSLKGKLESQEANMDIKRIKLLRPNEEG